MTKFKTHDKQFNKLGIGEYFLNPIKAICEKFTANITLTGEKLNASLIRSETRQCLFFLLLLNSVLEVLASAFRQEKEIKGTQMERKK